MKFSTNYCSSFRKPISKNFPQGLGDGCIILRHAGNQLIAITYLITRFIENTTLNFNMWTSLRILVVQEFV